MRLTHTPALNRYTGYHRQGTYKLGSLRRSPPQESDSEGDDGKVTPAAAIGGKGRDSRHVLGDEKADWRPR